MFQHRHLECSVFVLSQQDMDMHDLIRSGVHGFGSSQFPFARTEIGPAEYMVTVPNINQRFDFDYGSVQFRNATLQMEIER